VPRFKKKTRYGPDDIAYGINPVTVALERGLARRLIVVPRVDGSYSERVRRLIDWAVELGLPVEVTDEARMAQLTRDGVHQGVACRIRLPEPLALEEVAARLRELKSGLVLLVDQVTDPHNLGAIIRTACAVGTAAVVLPGRRTATLTPSVHKASAGMSLIAPLVVGRNLAQAAGALKEAGCWVVAAQPGEGSENALTFDWPEKTALIVGSEGAGISELMLKLSDFRVHLPMEPGVESLNVNAATAALCYLWKRSHETGSL